MAQDASPIPCYVETAPGLAEVAWMEIRERFPRARFGEFLYAKDENGIVLFTCAGEIEELFSLRTAESIFLTATFIEDVARGYRDLSRLSERLVQSGDLGRAINAFTRYRRGEPSSYHVVVRKFGRHEYSRRDVRQAVMRAVEALYPAWLGKQENADLEIWANVIGSNLLVGVRVPPKATRRSQPADFAGIRPSVAAAAILLTKPGADERFVDPLCDTGVLLAERVSAGPAALIAGGDTSIATVTAAQRRASAEVAVVCWQPDALPLATTSVQKMATLFPYAPAGAYVRWLGEVARVLHPQGRAVVLTPAFDQFKDAIREHPSLTVLGGYSTTIQERWGRIYIVRRE